MAKRSILIIIAFIFLSVVNFCFAQEKTPERVLVLREAKEHGKANVAVEAYLIDDILEVIVAARVYASRPRIDNVLVVGPKLGRLSAKMKKTLNASEIDEAPYLTQESKAWLHFGSGKETKKLKGAVARELFRFKIPRDKIVSGKRYELRIRIESMKLSGKTLRLKFFLEDLPELLLQ